MLLSVLSVLVVAQSSSEVPEGLMNNPVLLLSINSEELLEVAAPNLISVITAIHLVLAHPHKDL